jgi:hypothetical protein
VGILNSSWVFDPGCGGNAIWIEVVGEKRMLGEEVVRRVESTPEGVVTTPSGARQSYVLQTRSQQEKLLVANLEALRVCHFLPLVQVNWQSRGLRTQADFPHTIELVINGAGASRFRLFPFLNAIWMEMKSEPLRGAWDDPVPLEARSSNSVDERFGSDHVLGS